MADTPLIRAGQYRVEDLSFGRRQQAQKYILLSTAEVMPKVDSTGVVVLYLKSEILWELFIICRCHMNIPVNTCFFFFPTVYSSFCEGVSSFTPLENLERTNTFTTAARAFDMEMSGY